MDLLKAATEAFQDILGRHGPEAADHFLKNALQIASIPETASAELVDSALRMANTEVARVAHSTGNGSCVVQEFPKPDPARIVPMPGVDHGE